MALLKHLSFENNDVNLFLSLYIKKSQPLVTHVFWLNLVVNTTHSEFSSDR